MLSTGVLSIGSQALTNPVSPLTGGFTLDNEYSANPPVTSGNVTVDSITFTAGDVAKVSVSGGVTAIDWLNGANDLLSLVFSSPLTSSGGTVALNTAQSSFTSFASGTPASITGSDTAVPGPFTLLGVGASFASTRRLRRRILQSRQRPWQCFGCHGDAQPGGGFVAGSRHPISGLDHLVVMVAVSPGVLAPPAFGMLTVAFPMAMPFQMAMAFGGLVGLLEVPITGVEIGIAVSGLMTGLKVLFELGPPLRTAAA
jgi:hypothetical protein